MLALVVALLPGCATLALPERAMTTTGIETTVSVRVTLSDRGVMFSPRLRADTNTTIEVKVINRSSVARRFRFGFRETRSLRPRAAAFFYYSFHLAGRVQWRSRPTARGRTFFGKTHVAVAPMFGGG